MKPIKIYEVFNAVNDMRIKAKRETNKEPDIRIYMNYEFWHECMSECSHEVSAGAFEFYSNQTFCGHIVYRVPDNYKGKQHPSFEVVLCI